MSKDLLLEIGTEEIPAHYMPSILGQVKDLAEKSFGEANIAYESVRTLGTPRRIALLMKGVAEKQADVSANTRARRSPLPMTATASRPRLPWALPAARRLPSKT